MTELVASFSDGHAFHVPSLGLTMADGGEEPPEERRAVTVMTCPFLKEAQAEYCGTSSVRKLIPMAQAGRAEERCSVTRPARSSGSNPARER